MDLHFNEKDFARLSIGSVLYNKKTGQIVKTTSGWMDGYVPKHGDAISTDLYDGYGNASIKYEEVDDWDFITPDAPLEIRFRVLQERFFNLEAFVHSRLM